MHCENELLTGLDLIEHVNLLKSHILNKFHILSGNDTIVCSSDSGLFTCMMHRCWTPAVKRLGCVLQKMHLLEIFENAQEVVQHFYGSMSKYILGSVFFLLVI